MSKFTARLATDRDLDRWDSFVEVSKNGTLFHLRRFLSYHGDKFLDRDRFVVIAKGDQTVAQICYAMASEDAGAAFSPYGGSYGGLVVRDIPGYSDATAMAIALKDLLQVCGVRRLRFAPPLTCISDESLDTLLFAFIEQGAVSVNRDISSILLLQSSSPLIDRVTSRARNMLRKADTAKVRVKVNACIEDFWGPMEATFSRHGVPPTHSFGELRGLQALLPERVSLHVAFLGDEPVASACYFVVNSRVATSFYLAQTPAGESVQALTYLLFSGLRHYQSAGYRWFDFGSSSHGMVARPNIFRFKESFSAVGTFRETFEWPIA
jgi:hypothetical protein